MNIDELTQETRYILFQPSSGGWQLQSEESYLASGIVKIANGAFTAGTVLYIGAEYSREVVAYTITKDNANLHDLLKVLAKAHSNDNANTKEWSSGFREGRVHDIQETVANTAQLSAHLCQHFGSEAVTPEFLAGAMFGVGWVTRGLY